MTVGVINELWDFERLYDGVMGAEETGCGLALAIAPNREQNGGGWNSAAFPVFRATLWEHRQPNVDPSNSACGS